MEVDHAVDWEANRKQFRRTWGK